MRKIVRKNKQKQKDAAAILRLVFSLILVVSAFAYGGELSAYLSNFALNAVGLTAESETSTIENIIGRTKTKNSDKKNNKENQPLSNLSIDYLTETPKDVLANMLFEEEGKDLANGGIAKEKTFTKNDGTEVFKNIGVKNSTGKTINIEKLMQNKLDLKLEEDKPLILIYHTHTSESYNLFNNNTFEKAYSGRSLDENKNVVRIGKEIAAELEKAGIKTIHDTSIHDESYNDSYDHSREAVKNNLKKHPSIQITLDVHRDAIHYDSKTYCKPVSNIFGKQAAQVMILTGAEGGRIEDFPNWQNNLDFALKLHDYSENLFEGLMRPIMFCQRKYNLDLGEYSLLLEMGADANTLEEAVYSGRLIGIALSRLILDTYGENI